MSWVYTLLAVSPLYRSKIENFRIWTKTLSSTVAAYLLWWLRRLGRTACPTVLYQDSSLLYCLLSQTVNSARIITSMAKDCVETNCHYQYSTGYIKAICARVMCFDVNTNWPGFVHQPCSVRKTLKQRADVAVYQAFLLYHNSVNLQNTVSYKNSCNSASLKSAVSWAYTMSQSFGYNTVNFQNF